VKRRRAAASLRRLAAFILAPLAALPAVAATPHLELELSLDPATRVLRATAEWIATDDVRFALHRSLAPAVALADGSVVAIEPGPEADGRRIWRIDARPGARVRFEYGGKLPALEPRDHRDVLGPMPPMASNRGSFLAAGSGWYPAPGELFTYAVTLQLPAGQKGLVAGDLLSETPPGANRYTARFEFRHAAEGIDLMAGPYRVSERIVPRRGAAALRLRTYFTPGLKPLASGYLDDSRRYIELYEKQIGAYPFTGFSIVASPLPTGFGMPTLTYLGETVLKLPFIRATSLGHEVLHNWWGNGVYPDYASGNWSEGLTTFMADYAYKERESPAAARAMRLAWLRDFAAVPAIDQQTLASFRSRTHGAAATVGYGKSAMVFFMLRDLIGEEAFERGIRRFWERNRFRVASWNDLRLAFEQTSKRSLGAYFDQWLNRAGGPSVRIVEARARGKSRLALKLEQSAPPYALRLPVEIASAKSTETRWIVVERAKQTIEIDVTAAPDSVRLDPDLRVWRLLERSELPPILRQWILARAPRLAVVSAQREVASAARALGKAFFESASREVPLSDVLSDREPVVLMGLSGDIDRALAQLGLPDRPASLGTRGSAQIWTVRHGPGDALVAVVSARDAGSLKALTRPLPHYGAQSFLVFDGARALERGVWPASGRTVAVSR